MFPTEEFQAKAADFVLVHIDVDKDSATPQKYDVSGIPDIQFLNADGELVHRVQGYKGLDGLLAEMEAAKQRS